MTFVVTLNLVAALVSVALLWATVRGVPRPRTRRAPSARRL
jgi:hypothetical protein